MHCNPLLGCVFLRSADHGTNPKQRARAMTRKPRNLNAVDKRKMLAKFLNDSLAAGDTTGFVRAIGDLSVLKA
jgi:hypothetical protein